MSSWAALFAVLAAVFFFMFVAVLVAFIIAAVFAIRYGKMALAWEENINESLDILDNAYATMGQIRTLPVFIDSPEVRRLHAAIDDCREAVLYISNALLLPARPRLNNDDIEVVG